MAIAGEESPESTRAMSALVARSRQARADARRLRAQSEQLSTTVQDTLTTASLARLGGPARETRVRRRGMAAHPAGTSRTDPPPPRSEPFRILAGCFDDANQAVFEVQRTALVHIADGGADPVRVARAALSDAVRFGGVVRRFLYEKSRQNEEETTSRVAGDGIAGAAQALALGGITRLSVSLRRRRELTRRLAESRGRLTAGVQAQRQALRAVERGRGEAVALARAGLESALSNWNDITVAAHRRLVDAVAQT